MSIPTVSSILKQVSELSSRKDKVNLLRAHSQNNLLLQLLRYAFDKEIKFALPDGDPPYKPCEFDGVAGRLYQESRRLYLFLEGGNDNLHPVKRESLFIDLLESIDPEEAKLLLAVKDKKVPYKGITVKLVQEAFPGLV